MPLPYCLIEDIRRKLDLVAGTLDTDQRTRFGARARAASQRWDSQTGTPLRTIRTGAVDATETWEYHDARNVAGHPPVYVSLDYGDIVPIDSSAGDTIEIRTGRDSWDDVTDEKGDSWTLDHDRGQLKLYRFIINRAHFEDQSERFVRLTYRAGGLGGDRDRGTTTTLSSQAAQGATSFDVDNATRFPQAPFLAAVGETPDAEYVRVTDVDRGTDTLTVSRGARDTDDEKHDSGEFVQYVPTDVREAVAAKAAELLTLDDDARTSVPDDGQLTSRGQRADRFATEFDETAAKYASVRIM